jgi:hypothetical protein
MSRKVNLIIALLAASVVICATSKHVVRVGAQNVPPTDGGCCGKKPPSFPDLKATATTAAQTYSTFSGRIAVVTGQVRGGSSMLVVDLKNENSGVPVNANWAAPSYRHTDWATTKWGDWFGLTLDNQGNVFTTATTSYFIKSPVTRMNPGRVFRIDGTTGLVNVFATLPNSTPTNGDSPPALGNIFYDCLHDSFYVSNFADGRIYQIRRPSNTSTTGNVVATFDHQTGTIVTGAAAPNPEPNVNYSLFSVKNPPGAARGGRVWGLATLGGRLYYGVWRQDSGDHPTGPANEVWSVALTPGTLGGNFVGTPTLEITLPTLHTTNPINGSPFSNPVSSIAFDAAGDMLLAERTMNGDANNKNGTFVAHASRYLEYTLVGTSWQLLSPAKFGPGALTSSGGPSSAGGAAYDPSGARVWGTADAMHLPGNPPGVTDSLYGIQGLPMSGGTVLNSLLVDLTDPPFSTAHKNQMGDVEIPCADCATPSPSPVECCDKISAVPYPQNDLQLDYRTFTITNLKAPSSPICYVDISMNPTPNPIWQGGKVYVDNNAYSVGGLTAIHFGSPYTRLPNLPSPLTETFSAINTVKFNLGVDYTIGWVGTVTFVVHHCDGSTCTLRYGPWSALPPTPVPGPQVFDISFALEGKLANFNLQLKPRSLRRDIKWISFRVADESGQIFGAVTPATATRGRTVVAEATLEDGGLNRNFILYAFAQPLKSGQASSAFNLVVKSDSNAANAPLVFFTTYDADGNALETGTLNGTVPR